MRQKIGPFMLSGNLKSKISFYFVAIIVGVGICILNFLSPERGDDYVYKFVFMQNMPDNLPLNLNRPVNNLKDIFISQYNHYFLWNGRTMTHFLVQFFTGIAGKNVFNIVNAIIFLLFIISLLTYTNYKKNALNFLFATGLIFFLFPTLGQTVFWMTGAINYLWTCTFICFLLIAIKKTVNYKYKIIDCLLFFPALLIGWTHEGLTVPLAGSLLIYTIVQWRSLKNSVALILIIGFLLGALFSGFGPATIHRAHLSDFSFIDLLMIKGHSFIETFFKLKAFFVLIVCLIIDCIIWKNKFYNFYKENLIEFNALIFSFGILFISGFWDLRAATGVEFFSIILILKILRNKRSHQRLLNMVKYAVSIGLVILFGILLKYNIINNDNNRNNLMQLEKKESNIIKYDNLNIGSWLASYFVYPYFPIQINPEDLYNKLISKIYSYDYLIFIPRCVYEETMHQKGHPISLRNQSDFPFYIFPVETTDKSSLKVSFVLRPTNEDEIPFYLKPFASKMLRYTATEIESPTHIHYIIQIDGKSYLIVSKNTMIDNRVIDIKIE